MKNNKKFVSMKDWGIKDYKKNAILGILMGIVGGMSRIMFVEIIGSVLFFAGIILGIIWIYKTIKEKGANIKNGPSVDEKISSVSNRNLKLKNLFLKFNKHKYLILTIIIILGAFCWFQLRPTIIRRQCSWYEYVTQTPAVPAVSEQKGVTREDAEKILPELLNKYNLEKPTCNNSNNFSCELDLLVWESTHPQPSIDSLIYKPAVPEIPAGPEVKNWRNSTEKEYNDCLRHRGIIK